MSSLNPYEKYLDGRPPEAILASTTDQLRALINAIGPEKSTARPAPGKWSPAEIVCHLADCELVFGFRLRQTLAEDSPTIQPFDQEKWAETYPAIGAEQALATFTAFRKWNLLLIAAAIPAAADRPVTHPERGQMTFQTIVETIAGHDLNHLAQLQALAASATS
jgi:uncharacterized damage-inducible protein DinB